MLSLVAYQSSEESESEPEESENSSTNQKNIEGETKETECRVDLQNEHEEIGNGEPKSSNSLLSFAVPTKAKETVKITVPSLKEFEDDDKDEPAVKKIKKVTGSGLISMLPPPKHLKPVGSQKPFVPYVLTKKPSLPNSEIPVSSSSVELPKKAMPCIKPLVRTECHTEKEDYVLRKDDPSSVTDFFSLQEPVCRKPEGSFSAPLSNTVLRSQGETLQITRDQLQTNNMAHTSLASPVSCSTSSQNQAESSYIQHTESASSSSSYSTEPAWADHSSSSTYPEALPSTREYTADEGFLRLQGKKRKGQEEINIIDVSVDDQLSDKTEWLTKSLTEEKVHRPSRKKHDLPTQLQKRKHQITYLAFQAKERELELKNQWSQNKLTKRETQAKYGF